MRFSRLNPQYGLLQSILKVILSSLFAFITLSVSVLAETPQIPNADFTVLLNPFNPQMVLLDATASFDPDGIIENYQWISSVGHQAIEPKPHFEFEQQGIYTIALQISDNEGLTDTSWYTLSVGNSKTYCHPQALYFMDTQEVIIPFLILYDPFNRTALPENPTAAYTVTLQADAAFNFRIKPDSLAFVDMVAPNPCHALYADLAKTLHIPFIQVMNLPDTAFVYQATLQHSEAEILTVKTLKQLE